MSVTLTSLHGYVGNNIGLKVAYPGNVAVGLRLQLCVPAGDVEKTPAMRRLLTTAMAKKTVTAEHGDG